jgi:DNA-directed RNA polymerase alpha subunit
MAVAAMAVEPASRRGLRADPGEDRLPIARVHVLGLLTARTCNTLRLAGITDFTTLMEMSDAELLEVHDLGRTRLAEIRLAAQLVEEADAEAVVGMLGSRDAGPGPRFSDRHQASLVEAKRSGVRAFPEGPLTLERLRESGLISHRICNAFRRRGLRDLATIDAMSDGDLLSMPGVGPRTVAHIRALAAAHESSR